MLFFFDKTKIKLITHSVYMRKLRTVFVLLFPNCLPINLFVGGLFTYVLIVMIFLSIYLGV